MYEKEKELVKEDLMGNKIVAINIPEEIWDELVKQNGSIKLELDDAQNLVVSEDETTKWPTAPYVWWDGYLWEVTGGGGRYVSVVASIHSPDLTNRDSKTREKATRFAREAVPVTLVPTEAWEKWKSWVPNEVGGVCAGDRELINDVDSLAQEVAR